jgi:hypothetical protein
LVGRRGTGRSVSSIQTMRLRCFSVMCGGSQDRFRPAAIGAPPLARPRGRATVAPA